MTKKVVLLLSASMIAGAVFTAPAVAGGGAHCDPKIEDARTTTVALSKNCFNPTVARIRPGDEVTFINKDAVPHTVTGALFTFGGMEDLNKGNEATYRFDDEGIFPYYCIYHPGMAGAVVVGDGVGKGGIGTVTDVSFYGTNDAMEKRAAEEAAEGESPTSATEGVNAPLWSIALAAFGALAVLLVASTRIRKRIAAGVAVTTKP